MYLHSLPTAAHDVGEEEKQDQCKHQGDHDAAHVVQVELSILGGVGRIIHPLTRQNSRTEGGAWGRGRGLGQVNLEKGSAGYYKKKSQYWNGIQNHPAYHKTETIYIYI